MDEELNDELRQDEERDQAAERDLIEQEAGLQELVNWPDIAKHVRN